MNKLLNKRQEIILKLLESQNNLNIAKILNLLRITFPNISKVTINRDLKTLIELNYVSIQGRARATSYKLSAYYSLIREINVEKYFQLNTDERKVKERFNFTIFPLLHNILTISEKTELQNLNQIFLKNLKTISAKRQKREFERLIIELSWKSSQIEGNTYSLLETEALINRKEQALGHDEEEAIMILNHKKTLDYINENKAQFIKISVAKIEDIHYLLTKDLNITRNLRKVPVNITGTKYRPLDNQQQIKEALEKACILVNEEKNIFSKTLLISLLIAYIQPFEDGNKRTSRLVANAILMANKACPLSYRNVNEVNYKKAVILFYEINNLSYFKQLLIEQFRFAVNNYFK